MVPTRRANPAPGPSHRLAARSTPRAGRTANASALARFAAAAAALVLVAPAFADAASVSLTGGAVVRWQTNPVPFVLHPACSADLPTAACLDEVRKSYQAWMGPACSYLAFSDAGFSNNLKLISVGYNENKKNEFAWIENGAWTYGKYVLGVTSPLYYTSGKEKGVIIEADIAMNGYLQTWAMSGKAYTTDVMNVAVHEIGHFFGLQHNLYPNNQKPETMAPTADPFMGSRTPEADDIAGLCFLYPKAGSMSCGSNNDCPKVVDDGPQGEVYVGQIPCNGGVCAGAPTAVQTGGKKLGDACVSDADCDAPTFCQPLSSSQAVCSQLCNPAASGSCPSGFGCVAYQGQSSQGACIKGAGGSGGGGGSKDVGEPCASHSECKLQLCVALGGGATCETPCTSSSQCPSGQSCQLFAGKTYGACATTPGSGGSGGKLGDGATCTASSQCTSSLCVGSGSTGTCVADCTAGSCKGGYACVALSSGKAGCFETGDKKLGDPCQSNLDCVGALCAPNAGAYVCSQSCSGSKPCPSGYDCFAVSSGGACFPSAKKASNGETCDGGSDCQSGLCVGSGVDAICSQPCSTDSQCGAGAACAKLTGGGGACVALGDAKSGEKCESPYECATGECVDFGKGYVCGAPCNGQVDCACGEQCSDFGGESWCAPGKKVACVADYEPCADASECVGGLCLGGKCAPGCSIFGGGATCGEGKGCVRLEADKPEGVCSTKGPEGFGSPCSGDTGCVSLFCHGGSCGRPCNPFGPNTCTFGMVCKPAAGSVGACVAPAPAGEDVGGGDDAGGAADAGGGAVDGDASGGGGGDGGAGGGADAGSNDGAASGGAGGGTTPAPSAPSSGPFGCSAGATPGLPGQRAGWPWVVALLCGLVVLRRQRQI